MIIKTGIWLDKKEAIIVDLLGKTTALRRIDSNIESYHPKGGSRSKTVFGPVMTVKEKSYLEREKKQMNQFFKDLVNQIKGSSEIYICGPAEMKFNFKKYLDGMPSFNLNIIAIETIDRMTENQLKAKVKSAFLNT